MAIIKLRTNTRVVNVSVRNWKNVSLCTTFIGKGKSIPLQAFTGREVSRRVRLPDFKTIGT
jgi:hypothetical protein